MDSNLIETHLIKCLSRAQDMDFFEEDSIEEEKTGQVAEEEKLTNLFQNLQNPEKRQEALLELSLMEDTCEDLAVHIFYSSSTLAIL